MPFLCLSVDKIDSGGFSKELSDAFSGDQVKKRIERGIRNQRLEK